MSAKRTVPARSVEEQAGGDRTVVGDDDAPPLGSTRDDRLAAEHGSAVHTAGQPHDVGRLAVRDPRRSHHGRCSRAREGEDGARGEASGPEPHVLSPGGRRTSAAGRIGTSGGVIQPLEAIIGSWLPS